LKRLGATLIPLALVSVGYQLRLSAVRGKATALVTGLFFKLVLAPAVILFLFAALFGAEQPLMELLSGKEAGEKADTTDWLAESA
jgi:predicted permease